VQPQHKEKHFLVTRVLLPDDPSQPITEVELEAVYTQRSRIIPGKPSPTAAAGDRAGY
jgi:hypothetical protein